MSTWRTVAFVSLAANLLVAGIAIGGYAAGARLQAPGEAAQARAGGGGSERPLRAFVAAMPPEQRAQTRREMARTFSESRDLRAAAREARLAVARAAGAEPYDAAAVKAALARMRAADGEVAARFHESLADRLATLSPEQRRTVLRALMQRRAERGGAMRGGMDRPDAEQPDATESP
ncbi:MAG: periplasmic heavy metal sensor [Alphaproteobacteria bacterium]|nr:periplasmic heavy metal sensor [Alphaproteobacteria bacterium]